MKGNIFMDGIDMDAGCNFYIIENGQLRPNGYFYYADCEEDTPWQYVECSAQRIPLDKFCALHNRYGTYLKMIEDAKQWQGEMTEAAAKKEMREYLDTSQRLQFDSITPHTKDGNYVSVVTGTDKYCTAEMADASVIFNDKTLYFASGDVAPYNASCLDRMAVPEGSVDLIVTSPPYNVGIEYNSNNDGDSYEDYLDFTKQWVSNAYSWVRDGARFCLNIPLDKNKGGQQSVGADITTLCKSIGWHYHSTIIWNEGNISRRTAWGSWLSASAPYVIAPVELIVVLYKGEWKKKVKGKSDITKDEFMAWTNGVWIFNGESKKRIGHPAPFPRELPKRCIKLFSFVGDTVCDPFSGSGTTMIEAAVNGRRFIGTELDAGYCELSRKRFADTMDKERGLFDER